MRVAMRMRPEKRRPRLPPSTLIAATSADALSWTWVGAAVTSWNIRWGTSSGSYTSGPYAVADPNARAALFSSFLVGSGTYYIAVFGVDGGGEGDRTNEVAVSYTA